MRFCPFAQRVHHALDAKQVPYHVVNINLSSKPEWYSRVNPNGKVPALQLVDELNKPFVYESLVVCEYLDEKYPEPPLYPRDPLRKVQAKLLIEKLAAVAAPFYRLVFDPALENVDKALDEFHTHLDAFETEFKERKSTYFGGSQPNIIDYALWPWSERFGVVGSIYADKYKFNEENYPLLVSTKQVGVLLIF